MGEQQTYDEMRNCITCNYSAMFAMSTSNVYRSSVILNATLKWIKKRSEFHA